MNKKKHILIILSLIMVAVFTSACKQSKQAKGDGTSEISSIYAGKTETSQEDSIDFSRLTGGESNGGTSQKNNSEKADNKTASDNKSTANNKNTTDNKGAADNKDKTDRKGADDNKETTCGRNCASCRGNADNDKADKDKADKEVCAHCEAAATCTGENKIKNENKAETINDDETKSEATA